MRFDLKCIYFNYDVEKNLFVKERCGFDFEDAIEAIASNKLVDIIEHQNKEKYPHQYIFVIKMDDYVYAVPSAYNKGKNELFLKTMYPSRKLTKEYVNE